ncbi:LmbU family transcriptional regulator [Amycolatopsis sp. A133]|uniref:LmbU family transcriptional regulator n=1 Tax=Amycolatopsis sp. A133 TaxID=3064472 RepID=UPI0027E82617|nr:LmbU family transcriptional regulator [Amycolatopsis sp. A133]MDQ7803516.1 LmbU family transcriptional regulator [Amycolatopsis sp. A133]
MLGLGGILAMRDRTNQDNNGRPYGGTSGGQVQPSRNGTTRWEQVLITRVGLDIPAGLPFDRWERAGYQLSGIADSSAWCLGDWLIYGKTHYADRYKLAVDAVALDYQTLRNYAWVARRFDSGRRRDRLSFQHHAEVAALPVEEQEKWLDRAVESMWSVKHLRAQLKGERTAGRGRAAGLLLPRIEVARARFQRWQAAAENSGADLDHWMVSMLDRAAAQTLDGHAGERQAGR